jgi:hypothetical protein
MPKATKTPSPLELALAALPQYLANGGENDDAIVDHLQARVNGYRYQLFTVFLLEWLEARTGPGIEFEMGIDTEDGTYFLYAEGEEHIGLDSGDFNDEDQEEAYRAQSSSDLENLAQEMNDWLGQRILDFAVDLVEGFNECRWARENTQEVVCEVLDKYDVDGEAFWAARENNKLQKTVGAATASRGRKPSL